MMQKINKNGFWQGHRLSYAAYNSESYDSCLLVLHKCHNRKCVNPEHLYQGTYTDNARDTVKAGRAKGLFKSKENSKNGAKVDSAAGRRTVRFFCCY